MDTSSHRPSVLCTCSTVCRARRKEKGMVDVLHESFMCDIHEHDYGEFRVFLHGSTEDKHDEDGNLLLVAYIEKCKIKIHIYFI